MKKIISLILAAILAASALASCSSVQSERVVEGADPYRVSSSDYADEAWLKSRLGEIPDTVTMGTADSLGIDMDDFESDGYIIRKNGGETILCGKTADGLDRAVRRYAKAVKYGSDVEDCTYHEGARIEHMTIAGRDISEYTIVYTHTAECDFPNLGRTSGNGEYAAREFASLLGEATGVTLPVSDTPVGTLYISFEGIPEGGDYGETEYSYEVKNGNLIFKGSDWTGGVSNGVYCFFERECNWHNVTYGVPDLIEQDSLDIPEGTYRKSDLTFDSFRQQFSILGYQYRHPECKNPNHDYQGLYPVACHGMQTYNFCKGVDYSKNQICYTDELRFEEAYENILLHIEDRLSSGQSFDRDLNYVDIAMGDNNGFCHCKECNRVWKEEGGATVGAIVRFANRMADEVNAIYPGIKFLIFAYSSTKQPPKTAPNENVCVTFCLDGLCFNHTITEGKCKKNTWMADVGISNQDFKEWLGIWGAMCPNMYLWYYDLDGVFAQFMMMNVLYEDVSYFRSLGIKGIFFNGFYHSTGTGMLEHDMLGTMQWNPDMTRAEFDAVLDRKITEYYGTDAVETYREYMHLIEESHRRRECQTCWTGDTICDIVDYEYVGRKADRVLEMIEVLIEDAESAKQEQNCKQLSLALLYEGCVARYNPAVAAGDTAAVAKLTKQYDLFCERLKEAGFDPDAYETDMGNKVVIPENIADNAEYWTKKGY